MESQQEKRLKLIDFYLYFMGKANRADLMNHGDISVATASRAFNIYRKEFPDNANFDVSKRCYVISSNFVPAFDHNAKSALKLLAWGTEDSAIPIRTFGAANLSTVLEVLSPAIVSQVTRAIINKTNIKVLYSSAKDTEERNLAPHSLFHGLGAWHIRSWDSKRNDYRCFRLSRIINAEAVIGSAPVSSKNDHIWNEPVTLSVGPHSKHENMQDLAIDLGLEGKPIRNIQTNAALAGYVLNDLRVDCSPLATLPPQVFNLQLMNRHELEDIESIQALVPYFS